jgi:hypothetical protein
VAERDEREKTKEFQKLTKRMNQMLTEFEFSKRTKEDTLKTLEMNKDIAEAKKLRLMD